jgi:hypothetical protein
MSVIQVNKEVDSKIIIGRRGKRRKKRHTVSLTPFPKRTTF